MAYRSDPKYVSSVLNPMQVGELINMKKRGFDHKYIARHFEIHRNTVTNILKRAAKSPAYDYDGKKGE